MNKIEKLMKGETIRTKILRMIKIQKEIEGRKKIGKVKIKDWIFKILDCYLKASRIKKRI